MSVRRGRTTKDGMIRSTDGGFAVKIGFLTVDLERSKIAIMEMAYLTRRHEGEKKRAGTILTRPMPQAIFRILSKLHLHPFSIYLFTLLHLLYLHSFRLVLHYHISKITNLNSYCDLSPNYNHPPNICLQLLQTFYPLLISLSQGSFSTLFKSSFVTPLIKNLLST